MGEERRRLLAEMENEVANVAQQLGDEAVAFLPDFVSAGSWITATQYAQVLTAKSSEQDYTVKMLSPFFEPFFKDLEDKSYVKRIDGWTAHTYIIMTGAVKCLFRRPLRSSTASLMLVRSSAQI